MLPRVILHASPFSLTSTIFKSEPLTNHHSYFELVVVAATDPCTLVRWIGFHKDIHLMMFLSSVHEDLILLLSQDSFHRINYLCLRSLKLGFLHGSLMALKAWGNRPSLTVAILHVWIF
jgi:hypothetical protein